MFTFHRTSSGPAEVWAIIAAEGTLSQAETRFGEAAQYNAREGNQGPSRFHEIGTLCAITRGEDVEFLLGCKHGLTEAEKGTLFVELEMLLGQHVYAWGSKEQPGWFMHETLGPWKTDATAAKPTRARTRSPKKGQPASPRGSAKTRKSRQ
jgi:hypothetical protein